MGAQLKEGNSINKTLLAFGEFIRAISEKEIFMIYRNSILTRKLKGNGLDLDFDFSSSFSFTFSECMQGEGLTLFIACVSNSCRDIQGTLSTL